MKTFEWADATSVEQAVQLTVKGSAFKAGGIDVIDLMKERLFEPSRLVNIRTIQGLDFIKDDADGLKVGPLVTLTQLSESEPVRKRYRALAQAAAHAATPQIRNVATLGGNVLQRPRCWYFRNEQFHCRKKGGERCFAQDGENQYHAIFNNALCAIVHPSAAAVALVAMKAQIEIAGGADARRRAVPIEDFFVLPSEDLHRENKLEAGELITQVMIPAPAANVRSYYIKQGEKESFDWPVAEAAVVLELDGDTCRAASVVMGAASPVPRRAKEAEAALVGKKIDEKTVRDAAEAALAEAKPLNNNGYKIPLFKTILSRTILSAARDQGTTL
ncbi:MAG TPA: FAD binding domain-containing protein [Tepidisphaeraceae bacterium]|nr:FAD binding domain-containing protein [Tepidisphaeraceae bacterium]